MLNLPTSERFQLQQTGPLALMHVLTDLIGPTDL